MRTMIEQDLGVDPSTGARLRRLYEVTTQPEDYPELDEGDIEDLHVALVELERLDMPTRQVAMEQLRRSSWEPARGAAGVRRAVFLAAQQRVFH